MPRIESSIGSVSLGSSSENGSQQYKRYVVDDPTIQDDEQNIRDGQPQQKKAVFARSFSSNGGDQTSDAYFDNEITQNHRSQQQLLGGRKIIRNESLSEDKEIEILEKYQSVKAKREEPIHPDQKNKLSILLGLRKSKKTITIDGHIFELKTLSALEFQSLVIKVAEISKGKTAWDESFGSRNVTIALSLCSLDGEPISKLIDEQVGEIDIDTRLSIIENMDETLVSELYNFYKASINVIPSSQEEAKEVIENLKGL